MLTHKHRFSKKSGNRGKAYSELHSKGKYKKRIFREIFLNRAAIAQKSDKNKKSNLFIIAKS